MKKLLTTLSILLIATASYAQTYTVERVIDGNTIVVTTPEGKSEKVRLIGIDTPESQPNGKTKRDSKRTGQDVETINKMGMTATELVKGLIWEGQEVRLVFDVQERDKYGRLLAYVFIDTAMSWDVYKEGGKFETGLNDFPVKWELKHGVEYEGYLSIFINAAIIKAGYATPMTIPPNVKYTDLFKELYEEAREEGRGLWKDEIKKDCVQEAKVIQPGWWNICTI